MKRCWPAQRQSCYVCRVGVRTPAIVGATALALTLVGVSPSALAASKVTPESAQEVRAPLRDQAQALDDDEAGDFLATQGREHADPVLLVDAAAAYKIEAEASRDIPTAEQGIAQARLALDMLHFLGGERATSKWTPVDDATRTAEIDRANELIAANEALIEEIEAEQAAANAPAPEPVAAAEPDRSLKPGTGMMIGGAGALTLGLGGVAVGIVGILKGREAQDEVEDPTVVGSALDDADRRGKNANIMAYTGFAVGAVGIGVGAALLGLGAKKRKAAGEEKASAMVVPTHQGLVITGRF